MIRLAQPRFDSVVLTLFSVVVTILTASPVDGVAPVLLAVRNLGQIRIVMNVFRVTP